MANPLKYIEDVYNAKIGYGNAATDDERKTHQTAAAAARKWLSDNGYGKIAQAIGADNATAEDVKKYMNSYAKTGKTPTRDYYYSLGKKYGLSSGDVDKLIGWDDDSGQVYFDGKLVGTPDAVIDGTSYWGDTSVLDKSFEDYASRTGLTRTGENQVSQENESLFAKYNQEYEDLKKTNPFTTEEAKAILAKYDLAGLQGRDNAVASNAGSNGGNIDSFAAANAMRQQAALVNQGQMAVLEAHQQKLDHARALLSDMGVNIDRVYNQNEASKNNDVARKSEIANVSGVTPDEWVMSNNPYMKDDGTLKDEFLTEDFDNAGGFSAIMENAKAAGNMDAYNAAAAARYYKVMGNYGKYGQYDDGRYITPGTTKTEAARQFDESIAAADRQINAESETEKYKVDKGVTVQSIKNEGSSTGGTKLTGTDKQVAKSNADSLISKWLYTTYGVENLFDSSDKTPFKPDWNDDTNEVYAARDKLNDPEAFKFIKETMLGSGWTVSEWENKLYEWKTNIAKKAAQIEGKDKTDPHAWIDIMQKWGWIGASEKAELDKKYGR